MAFGAGALVYAVSTELFGEALYELKFHQGRSKHGHDGGQEVRECGESCMAEFRDLTIECVAAVVGAIAYILLERCLASLSGEGADEDDSEDSESEDNEARLIRKSLEIDQGDRAKEASKEIEPAGGESAFAMWLGLLLDGIPESLMLGFMTKEGDLGYVLLISIFIANFPEAFSASAILRGQGMAVWKIMAMWLSIFIITGVLTLVGCLILPDKVEVGSHAEKVKLASSAAAEGFTGGSMFAMIATAMLPEAFKFAGSKSGFTFVLGFITSVFIAELGVRFGGTEEFHR
jgi:zinc transporter ZupT